MSLPKPYERYAPAVTPILLYKTLGIQGMAGIPSDAAVYHVHPIGLTSRLERFSNLQTHPTFIGMKFRIKE